MAHQEELRVPYWLPRLVGKPNWVSWRKNLEEAIYEVDHTGTYWDIIMDRPSDDIKKEPEISERKSLTKPEPLFCSANESDTDSDVVITGISCNGSSNEEGGSQSRNRRVLNIRAREILGSSLEDEPRNMIDRISDAREAYLKLEVLYGDTSAQSIFVAWDKWGKVKYHRRMPPGDFVERFKNGLQDVREQSVEVPSTVVLAVFQQAIKSHPESTKYMADMRVDAHDPELMEKVYPDFIRSQLPAQGSVLGVHKRVK
jgi:hypothetical protein